MTESKRGILAGVSAYLMWGLLPLYWRALRRAAPLELLTHRMVWSLVVLAALLAVRRSWAWMRTLGRRRLVLLTLAAVLITVNWGVYMWGVNRGHVVESSLGYFTNPLVSVALGVLVLRERLRRLQWVAVGIGTAAVLVLTVDYGRPPWIALVLAATFGSYGLVKKLAGVPAVEALAVETAVLFLPAAGYLLWLQESGRSTLTTEGPMHGVLLVGAGLVTAVPLVLFGAAANRVPLSTIGLLQYLAPVLQLLLGVTVFDEGMPASRLAGFALVWLALAVLTYDAFRARPRRPMEKERLAAEVA